jgi:ribosomal protein L32
MKILSEARPITWNPTFVRWAVGKVVKCRGCHAKYQVESTADLQVCYSFGPEECAATLCPKCGYYEPLIHLFPWPRMLWNRISGRLENE